MTIKPQNTQPALRHLLYLAAFGVVAGGLFTGQVSASCGDYLRVAGWNTSSHAMASMADPTLNRNEFGSSTPQVPRRCHGPNCGKSAPVPLAPIPASFSAPERELSAWFLAGNASSPARVTILDLYKQVAVEGFPATLKRPPRG